MTILVKFRKTVMATIKVLMALSITLGFIAAWQRGYEEAMFARNGNYLVMFVYIFIFLMFVKLYGGFRIGILRLHELWYSMSISIVFSNFLMYIVLSLVARGLLSPQPIIIATVYQIFVAGLDLYCANSVYFSIFQLRHILAIYSGEEGKTVISKMSKIRERYVIDKAVCVKDLSIDELEAEIDKYDVVLICDLDSARKDELRTYCYAKRKRIYTLPSTNDIVLSGAVQSQVFDTPLLMCKNYNLTMEQMIVKRIMDIVVSAVMLLVASPIMLITALAIKLCDGGPVFFKQNRVTLNGKIFNVLKFRSMIVNADKEKDGFKGATDNDSRITPVGKIIRACRVDELPQLINILMGDMSLVGPRPERTEHVYMYTEKYPEFDLRHRVKGGLTGYAQIYGKYNTTPKDKLMMDLIYIENYSILLDLKLLFMTFKILFMKESTEGFNNEESEQNED